MLDALQILREACESERGCKPDRNSSCFVCQALAEIEGIELPTASISYMARSPGGQFVKLPRSRWRRALLCLRGYELYGG